jgi:XTP/dITP diphosphohydrolase
MESEFGDVLLMINYARFLNITRRLSAPIKKFIKRFQYLESKAGELGKTLTGYDLG